MVRSRRFWWVQTSTKQILINIAGTYLLQCWQCLMELSYRMDFFFLEGFWIGMVFWRNELIIFFWEVEELEYSLRLLIGMCMECFCFIFWGVSHVMSLVFRFWGLHQFYQNIGAPENRSRSFGWWLENLSTMMGLGSFWVFVAFLFYRKFG